MKIGNVKPKESDPVCRCGQGLAVIKTDDDGRICSQCWLEKERVNAGSGSPSAPAARSV